MQSHGGGWTWHTYRLESWCWVFLNNTKETKGGGEQLYQISGRYVPWQHQKADPYIIHAKISNFTLFKGKCPNFLIFTYNQEKIFLINLAKIKNNMKIMKDCLHWSIWWIKLKPQKYCLKYRAAKNGTQKIQQLWPVQKNYKSLKGAFKGFQKYQTWKHSLKGCQICILK